MRKVLVVALVVSGFLTSCGGSTETTVVEEVTTDSTVVDSSVVAVDSVQ